jgi:excinuclease UvrABC helicase subunit UvrB
MGVDVEIYLSGIIKFFKDNPKDLLSLVPKNKEEKFYSMIRELSLENYGKGDDYILTRNQILEICVQLNDPKRAKTISKIVVVKGIDKLKMELDIAIEKEEYELAAELRDQINKIS